MNHILQQQLPHLKSIVEGKDLLISLRSLVDIFPENSCFSTSFSMEDQVITDVILSQNIPVTIFTLDTGRLFPETYSVWTATNEKYGQPIKAFYPNAGSLEEFVNTKGPNAFYSSIADRKACCYIRKVEPLKRALAGKSLWITGLRAEHSKDRQGMEPLEWDENNQIIKFNPILHWNTEEVKRYIETNEIPYNVLHDKGFLSIGCQPCTRALRPGEDFRAGRWWWEDASRKECGLHIHSN